MGKIVAQREAALRCYLRALAALFFHATHTCVSCTRLFHMLSEDEDTTERSYNVGNAAKPVPKMAASHDT